MDPNTLPGPQCDPLRLPPSPALIALVRLLARQAAQEATASVGTKPIAGERK